MENPNKKNYGTTALWFKVNYNDLTITTKALQLTNNLRSNLFTKYSQTKFYTQSISNLVTRHLRYVSTNIEL